MPTVNSRLYLLQKNTKKRPLTIDEKSLLGRKIVECYYAQNIIKNPLQKVISQEPEGSFLVLSYPQLFVPEIDKILSDYLQNLPDKRKRIPIKPFKERSVKPTKAEGQIQGQ